MGRDLSSTRRGFLQSGAAGVAIASMPAPLWSQSSLPPLEDYSPEYFTAAEWAFVMAATARLIPSDGEGPGAYETRVPVFIDLQLAGGFGQAADWYMEGPHDPASSANLGYQTPLTPAEIYRDAIARFDDWCVETEGAPFAELATDAQDAALQVLEEEGGRRGEAALAAPGGEGGGESAGSDGEGGGEGSAGGSGGSGDDTPSRPRILRDESAEFFALLLQNTKEGYFSDPRYGGNHGMAAWVHIGFPGARANFLEWVDRDDIPYPLGPVSIAGERA